MIKLRLMRSLLSWFKGKQPGIGERVPHKQWNTVSQGFGARASFIEKRQQETGQGRLGEQEFPYRTTICFPRGR